MASRDEGALTELFARYGDLAYMTAIRIVGNAASAEDIVQEAFLKLWHNASQYSESRGSFRTWLLTAVRRSAIDRLRGSAGQQRHEVELKPDLNLGASMSDPSNRVSGWAARAAVREALVSLPVQQRLAIELAYFGSYTQTEIASMMGVGLGTVKGRMRLGLQKLSSLLRDRAVLDD
jgi:RNA polymerase sigma factor (sigma-70 family)